MYPGTTAYDRERLERDLHRGDTGFDGLYLTVGALESLAGTRPDTFEPGTIDALADILLHHAHARRRQAFFLYRASAETLARVAVNTGRRPLADAALSALRMILARTTGLPRKAAAEALGLLPAGVSGPGIAVPRPGDPPRRHWKEQAARYGPTPKGPALPMGRSLVVPVGRDRLLVVKSENRGESGRGLLTEAAWMARLGRAGYDFPERFDIPEPLGMPDAGLFLADGGRPAICFLAHADYFVYPNHHDRRGGLTGGRLVRILGRNACLLGFLAGRGIVHTAPIPLFHNRIQNSRRNDRGVYNWRRAGRLDRWLASCRYPNFAVSGIRDFEHLVSFSGSGKDLYTHIGTHLLSLVLVAASWFRNKSPGLCGYDEKGRPVDARHLFDGDLLSLLLKTIFHRYYEGFTGHGFCGVLPVDLGGLAGRMILEMGVDRHMVEILRTTDQAAMSDDAFAALLAEGGLAGQGDEPPEKGAHDIRLLTGPHLGGFNDRISIPELIEFLECASALIIAGRYGARAGAAGSG